MPIPAARAWLTALVAIPAALAVAAPPAAEGKAPRLVVEKESIDIGAVRAGEDAVATFVLRNEGDAPLHVLRAKPS